MSYSIFYDKQFIKVEKDGIEQFVPMILAGDSNLYENSGRRVRDWETCPSLLGGKKFGTLEEMLCVADNLRKVEIENNKEYLERFPDFTVYSDESFGSFIALAIGSKRTFDTTFKMYKSFITNGCKNALTVEELEKHGISIKLSTGYYSEEKLKLANKESVYKYVHSSEELVKEILELQLYLAGTGVNLHISMIASEQTMKRLRVCKKAVSKPKEKKEYKGYFLVRDSESGLGYIVKATKNGYKYNNFGKRFLKEKQAVDFANKLDSKFGTKERFKIKFVEEKVLA